jgi:hypothetical protein
MLPLVVRQILKHKGLSMEAIDWIVEDVSPRLSFLDENIASDAFVAPPGMSVFFVEAIRQAFDEILNLEIELYNEKGRPRDSG